MINAEVLELKKRFKKERATFYKVAGCYVNEKKEKVYTFNHSFLNMSDQEIFKYLEIATKAMSGKINNNLLNLEFPIEAEKDGEFQSDMYKMRLSEGADEELLNGIYDRIIASYQTLEHYLITLFFDKYDVPVKKEDKLDVDDSEEVFHYILCAICPVELTLPSLGFIDQETGLAITSRDWVVRAPEAGFMFPAFNDRSTDIHSLLFYTKNAKSPHAEMIDCFGCEYTLTSAQKKERFNEILASQLSDIPPEEVSNILIDTEYGLQQMIDAYKAEKGEASIMRVTDRVIETLVSDLSIEDYRKENISQALAEVFEDENTDAAVLVSSSNLKIGEIRAEKKVLANVLCQTERELERYKEKKATRTYETREINGGKFMMVPTEKNTTVIDGIEYVLIPIEE